MTKQDLEKLTDDITAPVREIVEHEDAAGFERWREAVLRRLAREVS